MKQFLSGSDLFALVMLLRSGTKQALLLVEGPTDSLSLTPHVDTNDTRIVVGYGRDSVEDAVLKSERRKIAHVVGLVDSDLDPYLRSGKVRRSANIITTTNYDLEADILFIPGLVDRLVFSQADRDVVESFMATSSDGSIVNMVARLACNVGGLRLESSRNHYGLYLREIPLDQFLHASSPSLDYERLAAMILSKSKVSQRTKSQVVRDLKRVAKDPVDFKLCCGHDLLRILGGALSYWWRAKTTYDSVGRILHAMLSRSELATMQIYFDLDRWARRHKKSVWAA